MSRTVVRAPNHLGDLIMALPAIRAAGGADVVALRWLTPLLEMVREAEANDAGIREILPLERGTRGMLRAAGRLRARSYDLGILLPPSLSSALLFALGGVRRRRGFPTDARRLLLTDPLELPAAGAHRASGFMAIVGAPTPRAPTPVLCIPGRERERWKALVGRSDGPLIGVSPGSNAPSRRWPPERYAEVVRRLSRRGLGVVVFGGPGEEGLVRFVSGGLAIEAAGPADLPLLAAGLADCTLALTNDSGPMHVAAAVGTPVVALIGPSDPRLTGPLGEGHLPILAGDLGCMPCGRNECPRTGPGTRLADAEDECMRLISVDRVEAAVLGQLARHTTGGG